MGIGASKKREKKEEPPKPVTAEELKNFIKISQERCKLLHNKKDDQIKKAEEDIAECLRNNNLDMARAKMDNLLKAEDMIAAYDILLPILEIISEKCIYIISNNDCPAELRAPLDSIIYAASRSEIEELMKFKEKILQKYGAAYISKAENNTDKLVNENLVAKLRVTIFDEHVVKIRLRQLCMKKKVNFTFPDEVIVNVPTNLNTNRNIYESTTEKFPTQSMIQPNPNQNQIPNPYDNGGNNGGYTVNNMYPNFSTVNNQGGFPSYPPQQNDGFPSNPQPQNPYASQNPPNPYEDSFPSTNNNNNSINNNYQPPPQNPNPSYVPPPVDDIMGKTVESTVPISEAPESKEQSQIKSNNQTSVKNPYLIESTKNNQSVQYQPPQMYQSAQNNNTITDEEMLLGKTIGDTITHSQQIPDNKDPFAPGAKVEDPFNVKTIKESGNDKSNNNNNNNNIDDEGLFGGETVGQTVNLSSIKPSVNNNSNNNDVAGIMTQTMNLSIANPDGKENPYEINESQNKDPFAPGAKVEDPFGVSTLKNSGIDDKTA